MAKTQQRLRLQKRDWVIVLLFIMILLTNWTWYQYTKTQDTTNKNDVSSWLQHQVEINKLKACIDSGIKPCNITPNY